jgi:3'(2'), 5'-bisphosphate nucleotidase
MVTASASRLRAEALERLTCIAREAGAAAMRRYQDPGAVTAKADRSPLTEADRASHEIIVTALGAWDPGTPVLSEEGVIPPWEERRGWSRFWLVDPLDGTKEFLQHNGEFTVNIALIEAGEPVLGVVYAPALDLLYAAGAGHGSWKYQAGSGPQRLWGPDGRPDRALVVVESRSHGSEALERYLRTVHVARRMKVGSSLKFGLVAEGAADLYPRFGPTMEWDVAAGDCVWRDAAREGRRASPLTYNKPDLANGDFVIGPA